MNPGLLYELVPYLAVLILSLTIHEWGHAASAWLLGDDTAARLGRLTLNPLPHIDPVGTLILPLAMILSGGALPLFGWAKPVPVSSRNFTRRYSLRAGEALTALAGPAMNLAAAVVATLVMGVVFGLSPGAASGPLGDLLPLIIRLNLGLAFFNLIPVPPLDGGWILQWALPARFDWALRWLGERGLVILVVAVYVPGYLADVVPVRYWAAVPFLGPDGLVRTSLALACGTAAWVTWRAVADARDAGRPRDALAHASVLEWALPLGIAFVAAQVSTSLTRSAIYGAYRLAAAIIWLVAPVPTHLD